MNRDDFETLVRLHQAEMFRYLRYLGAEHTVAEDLVQEVFVAAWSSTFEFESSDPANQSAYLRGIARNLFYQHCRRRRPSTESLSEAELEEAEVFWSQEFLRGGDGYDYLEALRRCLRRLTDQKRHVLDLFYGDDKSRREIAEELEMSEEGVKSTLQRTRAMLADCIRNRLNGSS